MMPHTSSIGIQNEQHITKGSTMTALTSISMSRTSPRVSLLARLVQLHGLALQRRALRKLSAEQLADVGITKKDAAIEGQRAFWDAPETWRC
jgi:uncharacterized protein YjiS (DUF1127 family)|tara:strand:+ start:164 stop:439 length:276 start_codon:yes stop_codon:yes gene_type:complete